jgi:hypothetical protein
MIEIWEPRWKDRTALIAKYKVTQGVNEIVFTKAKCLKGKVFTIEGSEIAKYPIESNGTIPCYAVPMERLS